MPRRGTPSTPRCVSHTHKSNSEPEKSDAEKRVSHHVIIGQKTGGVGPQQIAAQGCEETREAPFGEEGAPGRVRSGLRRTETLGRREVEGGSSEVVRNVQG